MSKSKKTLIAVLASRDSVVKNNELARVFEYLYDKDEEQILKEFHFVFCGGTFKRLVLGIGGNSAINPAKTGESTEDYVTKDELRDKIYTIREDVRNFLLERTTVLPEHAQGGVSLLANLVVQRQCSNIWPFLSPITEHWLYSENLSLIRLSNQWNVKLMLNAESVRSWFRDEAKRDVGRNPEEIPITMAMGTPETDYAWPMAQYGRDNQGLNYYRLRTSDRERQPDDFWMQYKHQTIALISHDAMKDRTVDFAIEYEKELSQFKRILATETTASMVLNACRRLRESDIVRQCLSGPKGGLIQIAAEILFNRCNIVVFFVDPLISPPQIDDIRVVYGACMAEIYNNDVRILTNEVQARDWIEGAVRRKI